jgi:N-acylglucosamine 2-epimerase
MASSRALAWAEKFEDELYTSVLPFWLLHAADADHGGFFDCLTADGAVYDTKKHVWLQGRMAFVLARVANEATDKQLEILASACASRASRFASSGASGGSSTSLPAPASLAGPDGVGVRVKPIAATREAMLEAATACVDFLLAKAVDKETGHVWFALTADGRPAMAQRKPFAAAFMGMAIAEIARATQDAARFEEALVWLKRFREWAANPGLLRGAGPSGATAYLPLNQPMILLNMIGEYSKFFKDEAEALAFMADERKASVEEILLHWKPDIGATVENVLPDGSMDLTCPEGRLHNPGHAIEAGWFVIEEGMRTGDAAMVEQGAAMARASLERGWDGSLTGADSSAETGADSSAETGDEAGGGIVYFLDVLGHDSTQLEADMKLWWPVCETLIALSMEYAATSSEEALSRLDIVAGFAAKHFSDATGSGEWVGYLSKDLRVTHSFKGGPYKGCFHVPRALMMSAQLLRAGAAKHTA